MRIGKLFTFLFLLTFCLISCSENRSENKKNFNPPDDLPVANTDSSMTLLTSSADESELREADKAIMAHKYAEGVKTYLKFADRLTSARAWVLGQIFLKGTGVKKDIKNAHRFLKDAAERGHPVAMNDYGYLLQRGLGTDKDEKSAMEWFERAAALGEREAMNNIGTSYLDGRGVPKDNEMAFKWFLQAAEHNSTRGMFNVAEMYWHGAGVKKDKEEAIRWFKQAEEAGAEEATAEMRKLGIKRD